MLKRSLALVFAVVGWSSVATVSAMSPPETGMARYEADTLFMTTNDSLANYADLLAMHVENTPHRIITGTQRSSVGVST